MTWKVAVEMGQLNLLIWNWKDSQNLGYLGGDNRTLQYFHSFPYHKANLSAWIATNGLIHFPLRSFPSPWSYKKIFRIYLRHGAEQPCGSCFHIITSHISSILSISWGPTHVWAHHARSPTKGYAMTQFLLMWEGSTNSSLVGKTMFLQIEWRKQTIIAQNPLWFLCFTCLTKIKYIPTCWYTQNIFPFLLNIKAFISISFFLNLLV